MPVIWMYLCIHTCLWCRFRVQMYRRYNWLHQYTLYAIRLSATFKPAVVNLPDLSNPSIQAFDPIRFKFMLLAVNMLFKLQALRVIWLIEYQELRWPPQVTTPKRDQMNGEQLLVSQVNSIFKVMSLKASSLYQLTLILCSAVYN